MNKYAKVIGKGFIDGIRHPFMAEFPRNVTDMEVGETLLYGSSMGFTQGVIQGGLTIVMYIGILAGLGYVNSKLDKKPINAKLVIDK